MHAIDYKKEIPNNRSLGVKREIKILKSKSVSPDIWQKTSDPIARVLLGLQIHFGLTASEAMRVIPDIHVRQSNLWLTREITFNSMDRTIPLRNDIQKDILGELSHLTQDHQSLISAQGYGVVCFRLNRELRALKLPISKSWRFLYAQLRYQQLASFLTHEVLSIIIFNEMGLKSRTTLWRYLRNQSRRSLKSNGVQEMADGRWHSQIVTGIIPASLSKYVPPIAYQHLMIP